MQLDPAVTFLFEEQIKRLKKKHNFAQQIDLRLMACTENCRIVVCDFDEKVLSITGPDGELEEYPEKTLSEVMGQYPEAELFVLNSLHFMTGRRKK